MKKYYKFEFNMLLLNILVGILFVIIFGIYGLIGYKVYGYTYFQQIFTWYSYVLFILYFVFHEIVHGLSFMIFAKDKRNIKFGATLEKGVVYALCQERISKKAALISLAAPIIVLTIIPIPFGIIFKSSIVISLAFINLIGAIGDIVGIILLLKCPDDVLYIDYDNNVGLYLVSKKDLSKIKVFGFRFVESGKDGDSKINKNLKKVYISKSSIIYILVFIVCMGVLMLF